MPKLVAMYAGNPRVATMDKTMRERMKQMMVPVLAADPDYLEQALASINADFGGIEVYVQGGLGQTADEVDGVRSALLV